MDLRRSNLVLEAQHRAMQLRQKLHINLFAPVCVYDLAERRGVEVRFVDFPTMEGI